MTIKNIEDLFLQKLGTMYDAEKQITVAIPKMAAAATDPALKTAFLNHLEETKGQIQRIEQAAATHGLKLEQILCTVTQALIRESDVMMKATPAGPLLDFALLSDAQKVEHLEIAGYTSLVDMAAELGFTDAADLLELTLDEEAATDEKLAALADEGILEDAGSGAADSMPNLADAAPVQPSQ